MVVQPKWLITNTSNESDMRLIIEALKSLGYPYKIARTKQVYEGHGLYRRNDHVIVHGSVTETKYLTEKYGWLSWLNLPATTCSAYYPKIGKDLLNYPFTMIPVSDLRRRWPSLMTQFGADHSLFIRPNENNKLFTARVCQSRDIQAFERGISNPAEIIVIAQPRPISIECRLVFHRKDYLTGSSYKLEGKLCKEAALVSREMKDFAHDIACKFYHEALGPVWVLDLCQTNGEIKVMEISGSCAAGFYDCDRKAIFKTINKEALNYWRKND